MSELGMNLQVPTEDEVKKLMKNIHDGINLFSLPKLNSILKKIIRKPMKSDNVEFVLQTVSKKFNISKENLINTRTRGQKSFPKLIVCVLLNRVVGESVKDIAILFKNFPNAISFALNTFDNLTVIPSTDGKLLLSQYTECEKELIKYLESQELK